MKIGQRIREIRGSRTQAEFADEVGIHRGHLAVLERGHQRPSRADLEKLHRATRCNVHYVLTGEGSPLVGSDSDLRYAARHGLNDEPAPVVAEAVLSKFGYAERLNYGDIQLLANTDDPGIQGTNLMRLLMDFKFIDVMEKITGPEFERLREWMDKDGDKQISDYVAALEFMRAQGGK